MGKIYVGYLISKMDGCEIPYINDGWMGDTLYQIYVGYLDKVHL